MSELDLLVDAQAKEAGWGIPAREARVCPERRFRLDYAWEVPLRVALEVDGGIWTKGGHSTGRGISRDMEKHNYCVANGWRVIRLTPQQVRKGELTGWLRRLAA